MRSRTPTATSTTCPRARARHRAWSSRCRTRSGSAARTPASRSPRPDRNDPCRDLSLDTPGAWMSAVFDVVREGGPRAIVARARLELLFDPGTFKPVRTAVGDGVLAGSGSVNGRPVCAWAQDGGFKGGSLGEKGGETIARTIDQAAKLGVPVVGFPHSGGARLQEGVGALHAYSRIFRAQAIADVPQISVIGGPCAGGAAYSPALGDLTVMAGPEARMVLTGPAGRGPRPPRGGPP